MSTRKTIIFKLFNTKVWQIQFNEFSLKGHQLMQNLPFDISETNFSKLSTLLNNFEAVV